MGFPKYSKIKYKQQQIALESTYNNRRCFLKTIFIVDDNDTDLMMAKTALDKVYLTKQLLIIKAACEDYNDKDVYAAIDCLTEKTWKPKTVNTLENIRDKLFLYSDFEEAAAMIGGF